eukprot:3349650-Karenia_brevis.AAC.1
MQNGGGGMNDEQKHTGLVQAELGHPKMRNFYISNEDEVCHNMLGDSYLCLLGHLRQLQVHGHSLKGATEAKITDLTLRDGADAHG